MLAQQNRRALGNTSLCNTRLQRILQLCFSAALGEEPDVEITLA
jgi:hypothetical protein